jgi:hypothetical protein
MIQYKETDNKYNSFYLLQMDKIVTNDNITINCPISHAHVQAHEAILVLVYLVRIPSNTHKTRALALA